MRQFSENMGFGRAAERPEISQQHGQIQLRLVFLAALFLLRFAVSDKDKLEFYSQDPSFEGQVNCGPVNKIAYIYFKPMPGQTKVAGDAVAVEFTRD